MTEFQELVKDAPEFASMERGELAIYAYAIYASGEKMEAENAKLRDENECLRYEIRLLNRDIEDDRSENAEMGSDLREYADENAKLRELAMTALVQVSELCEANKDRCATCPLHHGYEECRMVMLQNDAQELEVES